MSKLGIVFLFIKQSREVTGCKTLADNGVWFLVVSATVSISYFLYDSTQGLRSSY